LGCKVAESWFFPLRIVVLFEDSWQVVELPNLVPLSVAVFWILNSWFKDWLLGSSWSLLLVLESLRNLVLPKLSQWLATSLLMWEVTLPIFNQDKAEVCFQIEDFFLGALGSLNNCFKDFLYLSFKLFNAHFLLFKRSWP
jgi:hypothetical protein